MPSSRRRRRQRPQPSRRSGHPGRAAAQGRDPARAWVDLPLLQATDAAEARGDAMAALELIERDLGRRTDENFWRLERIRRLLQLVMFGSSLPRWVTSRWILDQAAQHLDPRTRGRARRAIDIAIETRGGPATLVGRNEADARAKVVDHDWVHRQVWLYELGALEHFVSRIASPDLLAGADRIADWVRTPMSAFRLVGETPQLLSMVDLATDRRVEALNIGSATLLEEGDCAIGRLVPIDGGAMFESAPLHVPDRVAHRVADDPVQWRAAVADGSREILTTRPEFGIVTDVPRILVLDLASDFAGDLSGGAETATTSAQDLVRAGAAFFRAALEDGTPDPGWGVKFWPMVAATLMDPHVFVEVVSGLTPADRSQLLRLADLLGGPAGTLCRELALGLDSVA